MGPTFIAMAGGLLALGFSADVGAGFFLAGELAYAYEGHWGLHAAVEGRMVLPAKAGTNARGPFDVTWGGVAAPLCARYRWVLGCAVLDVGVVGFGGPAIAADPFPPPLYATVSVGPRLGVEVPITERLGVRAFVDLRVSVLRDQSFLVDGQGWVAPRASGLAGLGISFR